MELNNENFETDSVDYNEEDLIIDNITKAIGDVIKDNLSMVFNRQNELNKILMNTILYKKMYQNIISLKAKNKNLKDENEKLKLKVTSLQLSLTGLIGQSNLNQDVTKNIELNVQELNSTDNSNLIDTLQKESEKGKTKNVKMSGVAVVTKLHPTTSLASDY